MCNSCHSYRASSRCSTNFMRALSNLFAVRSESTDEGTCDCGQNCSCSCNCGSCCTCTPCTCTPCTCEPCTCEPCTCEPCQCECTPCTCTPCSCDPCSCCSGSAGGGTDSYYARQYAIGRAYVSGCNSCYMGF